LKYYPTVDDVNALKNAWNISENEKIKYPVAPLLTNTNSGYYSKVINIVN